MRVHLGLRRPTLHRPADDRWPDRFAGAMLLFAALTAVVALVPSWHRFFDRSDDPLSLLTIPVVPSLVYAALLFVTGVALRRRLHAAWWFAVVWWLVLPEVGRAVTLADGEHVVLAAIGLFLVGAVIALAVGVRHQFVARGVPGSLPLALAVLLGGGLVMVLGGALLVRAAGRADDLGDAAQDPEAHRHTEAALGDGDFDGQGGRSDGRPVLRRTLAVGWDSVLLR